MKSKDTPWLVPESIEFLDGYLTKDMQTLEFGSGGSTRWTAKRVKHMVSVDHKQKFYNICKERVAINEIINVDLRLMSQPYDSICDEFDDEFFDFVLVDGRDRVRCVEKSMRVLKSGGILMLDNAQRLRYKPIRRTLLADWPMEITQEGEKWQTVWWCKP